MIRAIVVLCLTAAIFSVAAITVGVAFVTHQGARSEPKTAKSAAPKVWDRAEFRALVVGKTEREVIEAVGRPDSTQERDQGESQWYYRNRTRDAVTSKLDPHIQLVIQGGVVVRVNF